MYEFTDEYGLVWEVMYVVTQTEAEGPEFVQYREKGNEIWTVLPSWALIPKAMMEHFHGPVLGNSLTCQHCGNPVG